MLIKSEFVELDGRLGKRDASKNVYRCDWCNHGFEKIVRKSGQKNKSDAQGSKNRPISGVVSDQVRCPGCGTLIKTWS